MQPSRQDDGGRASGMAVGLDSRDILTVELARFDKGDKIFVSTLENWVGEVVVGGGRGWGGAGRGPQAFMLHLLNYPLKTLIKALAG